MKYNINLVQKKGLNFFEKILFFFSNYLRYILVITQLVVIITLFIRFQIDQNIIDLKESIDQKKEIINATTSLVKGAQDVNLKLSNIKILTKSQTTFLDMFNYIFSAFPSSISLSSISIDKNSVKMIGEARNPNELQQFLTFLRNGKRFKSVVFGDLKKSESTFSFSIDLNNFKTNK